jgi:hypothetical protein
MKIIITTILSALLISVSDFDLSAQSVYDTVATNYNCNTDLDTFNGLPIYSNSSILPEYPGGLDSLFDFISKNVRFQKPDTTEPLQFKIVISFIIDTAGICRNFCVVNRLYPDRLTKFEIECLRVYSQMPTWTPAVSRDRKVPYRYTIPTNFDYD